MRQLQYVLEIKSQACGDPAKSSIITDDCWLKPISADKIGDEHKLNQDEVARVVGKAQGSVARARLVAHIEKKHDLECGWSEKETNIRSYAGEPHITTSYFMYRTLDTPVPPTF